MNTRLVARIFLAVECVLLVGLFTMAGFAGASELVAHNEFGGAWAFGLLCAAAVVACIAGYAIVDESIRRWP